ncbi:MAG: hypothetical protein L6R43_18700 [Planctomycetes bacterium]|nr:hypothetical protein [Planctomycetota bacterium]
MKYRVRVDGREIPVEVEERAGAPAVTVEGRALQASLTRIRGDGAWTLLLAGRSHCAVVEEGAAGTTVTIGSRAFRVEVEDEREAAAHSVHPSHEEGPRVIRSVMPGIVREVLAAEGEAVEGKAPLLVLEAMKMQNEVRADRAGRVARIHVAPGTTVARGDALVTLE